MKIGDQDLWECKGKIYDTETGEEATEEVAVQFRAAIERQRKEAQERRVVQEVKQRVLDKEFHDKYDAAIKELFGYDNEDFEPERWDRDSIIYHMSTTFFDVCSQYGEDHQDRQEWYEFLRGFTDYSAEDQEYMDKLRIAFGDDIYVEAWEGFLDGAHDT